MTQTTDQLADLRAAGERLHATRSRQAEDLAAVAWQMWQADWGQASRTKIVTASGLAHQAGWDVLRLLDEACEAYVALAAAGVPTDQSRPSGGMQVSGGVEVSLRPLSTRKVLVSLDAVPGVGPTLDVPGVWSQTLAVLRAAGWTPREVEQPEDPGVGVWRQATITRRR